MNLSDTGGDADNYGDLSRLTHLQSLNISHNRLTTLEALHLQKLRNLRRLNISHNQLENVDFGEMAQDRLQVLNLSFNRLGHLTFAPLPHLNTLFLHRNYNVFFDKEFELQDLRSMTFDKGTKVPDDLLKQIGGGNSES
ncbi:chondroadherin-like protein [Candidatus Thiomargarita nelsonii]|uniref:Chondroadherin-like protein n=1 Tax=Candidatus Thiomargarita nelsonii TaxID=1003181 RepID=A0A176S244_9GAMM|nr:chondroadherin-like protein [Candidatus Thiomargarita nelsonii]